MFAQARTSILRGVRLLSAPPMEQYEQKIYDILKLHFSPSNLAVKDVSGGCGSMFAITVESPQFKGIPMIKQHRLVNEVLKDEIAKWHGLQLKTKAG
ncbi:CIC11C00000004216 [Sungouiella intermedia]|uniref:CIC11C00000000715 n=1 Tax=Sungouiella intermedia TaxID=45354 RepID=A0A1L0BPD4_9ASCO|nr:CIC11C00000004216 [[Candida] intermedia]SGZ53255.1 CIC11C00000000715 [[Candida] intermedia]